MIGGSTGALGAPVAPLGFFAVLVGVVLVGVALVGVALVEVLGTGLASGAAGGGGVEVCAPSGGLGDAAVVVEGATATMIGATAPLSCTGLTPEPTSTPNASSAITATAVTDADSLGDSPSASTSCGSACDTPRSSAAASARANPSCGTTPIRSAIASGRGPLRAPHSTQ